MYKTGVDLLMSPITCLNNTGSEAAGAIILPALALTRYCLAVALACSRLTGAADSCSDSITAAKHVRAKSFFIGFEFVNI